ncbi:MAG: peptidylprolyl isomerase [Actinomycetales bacterium]|nr:peptidylprolyl isomerase [Actinomycetales bacterium]
MASKQSKEAREARDRLRLYEARQEVHAHADRRRTRDNVIAIVAVLAVASLAGFAQTFYFVAGPGAPTPAPTSTEAAVTVPDPSLAEGRTWTGDLTLNDVVLGVELDGAAAPQAVSSIVQDVQDGYYVGRTCHRLTTGSQFELVQCGSVDDEGGSDPNYRYGPIENAPADEVYPAGTIAMARASGDAFSNGHQFFITYGDTVIPSDSAGGYTVVGTVTSGLDEFVAQIASAGITPGSSDSDGTPTVPISITAFTLQ